MIYIVCDFCDEANENTLSCDHFPKISMEKVMKSIQKINYNCTYFGGISKLVEAYSNNIVFDKSDLFLNMSDGLYQNSRRMQAPVLLDLLGVKYTGSSPFAVGLMNNKHFSKIAAEKIGIKAPKGVLIHSSLILEATNYLEKSLYNISFPLIVKPNGEGSSIGIDNNSIVYSFDEMIYQINMLKDKYDDILIEQFIPGTDASTLVVGNCNDYKLIETLVYKTNNQFVLKNSVRDTYIKENWVSIGYLIDNVADYKDLAYTFKQISKRIFEYIGCNDIARIDYRISEKGEIYFLEINSMPTITPTSDAGMICNCLNKPYTDFLKEYIDSALSKYSTVNRG